MQVNHTGQSKNSVNLFMWLIYLFQTILGSMHYLSVVWKLRILSRFTEVGKSRVEIQTQIVSDCGASTFNHYITLF